MQLKADNGALQQRFAALTEIIPQFSWTSGDNGKWIWASARWVDYTGLSVELSRGLGWLGAVHPDDHATTMDAWQKAMVCGVLDVEHRLLCRGSSGETRWFHSHATPLPGSKAQMREWLGICTDVHETRMLENRRRLMLSTLQRRVGNVLALTRSVARRTAKASETAESFALHLDSRLDAIARTQTMLISSPTDSLDLKHLVTDGLLAYAAHEGEQVRISGPSLPVQGKAAELLGLAVHEFAMNAVEHGALATLQGAIDIRWCIESGSTGDVLRFEWLESGVALGRTPCRRGFGTELIEHTLAQELGAKASIGFGPHGVRAVIVLPLTTDLAAPYSHP